MKVFITGGSGGLGRYVQRALSSESVIATPRSALDIQNPELLLDVLCMLRPDVVVHLAAMTDTALCERDAANAIAINAQGTANVARASAVVGARVVYMSTDAVFSGEGPHGEEKPPAPASVYGWTKLAGEQAVLAVGGLSIRANFFTRYCNGKTSFAAYVLREAQAGRPFPCHDDVQSTPVFAGTLANQIARAVLLNMRGGVFHVASSHSIARPEQARLICTAYGLSPPRITAGHAQADGRLTASRAGTCGTVREEIEKMVKEEPL